MTQDNLTVDGLRKFVDWRRDNPDIVIDWPDEFTAEVCTAPIDIYDFLLKQVESQDEITDALHIVNAELGRRVESQKEEIASGKRCVNAAQGWLNDSNVPLHGRVIRATATLDNFSLPKEE